MLQEKIIEELNIFLKNYLGLPFEPLKTKNYIHYKIEGSYDAINYKRNDSDKIKVVKWFGEFYLYLEVNYSKNYLHKMISVSIFQGKETELKKNQLFRAEWDDYNIENESRPQPHWHITKDKANYEKYSDLIDDTNESEKNSFDLFKMSNSEIFDTKKIHFAMSSNWQNQKPFAHKIDDASKVVKWIEGLLEHIKYELLN